MNPTISEAADMIEAQLTEPDDVIALPILNAWGPVHRKNLIDHHGQVVAELRRRGVPIRVFTQPKHDGVALVIARREVLDDDMADL